MITYSKPIRTIKQEQQKKEKKTKGFLKKLWNPPKKKDELKEAYKQRYDEVFKEERKKFLKEKAERDAKKRAKMDNSIIGIIIEAITGGRNNPK